ncbi:ABC transporter ATP-binding protein [Lachnoclostridium sp. Marseille-P6806]|uniref:ABC transporter ATP-binding protein n=1 Tax=Lachnoclostridium sp. Marseille-P6806 TaxID=2364793 RepID=UPI001F5FA85A|nr:energy-coupling factor ABC transporter ATP-binding protein [Lachnoclostridium sp. Marseille-P6806]
MIELKDVSFRYEGAKEQAVRHVSLTIERGECMVLTGLSGCGKTTITRLINGLIPDFYPGELSGSIFIDGEDIAKKQPHELSSMVGSVFQNPRTQFFNTDTDSELVFGMENSGVAYAEMHRRYDQTVRELQLHKLCGRDIFALSGGEKQSIAFGSIYALSPEIYLLDEPSANLDRQAIRRLRDTLLKLKTMGKTILISEHRLYYLRGVADRAALVEQGKITEIHPWETLEGCTDETLHQKGLRSIRDTTVELSEPPLPAQTPVLAIRSLAVARKKNVIFDHVDLTVSEGEIVGITEPNGFGKTTLARIVCGLMKEKSGSVLLNGVPARASLRKRSTFLVMQDPNYQLFSDSVEHELKLTIHREAPQDATITEVLRDMDLEEMRERHPLSLSGGQKQRLCIALAALSPARLLIFDEPTSGLDYRNMQRVAGMIHKLADDKRAVLVISHDNEFLNMACTRIISLAR